MKHTATDPELTTSTLGHELGVTTELPIRVTASWLWAEMKIKLNYTDHEERDAEQKWKIYHKAILSHILY